MAFGREFFTVAQALEYAQLRLRRSVFGRLVEEVICPGCREVRVAYALVTSDGRVVARLEGGWGRWVLAEVR